MLVSLEWLNEYVDISNLSPEQIAHELTMSGLEVEEIEKIGADFTNIVVAQIREISPHPDAEKLQLAKVFNGTEEKTVVCGAKNIAVGQLIPYATVGSEVMDRKSGEKFSLKPAKIRGVESQGMLCSAEELGLKTTDFQEDDGILILNKIKEGIKPGQDIKEVLGIKEDNVLHVAPTANRGDEMSVLGIAREISAIFNKSLKSPKVKSYQNGNNPDFSIEIKDFDTCKYYSVGIIKDVKIKPAPEWMARRLIASGVRSISNVVDITNYVMLEYGQPLHAFDTDKLGENYLSVRRAYQGEKAVTLDEAERELTTESVLIATKQANVGLAGLMGGFTSEVDAKTQNIALESAYFIPQTTRKSARSVGLRTEASARFERGVDMGSVRPALMRAMQLMEEYADAKIIGISETGENKLPDIDITLRFSEIKRILGTEIPESKCVEILENLGFETLGRNTFSAKFRVPSYRINDVTREIDLIEEISRIHGYDKIETTLPKNTQPAEVSKETQTIDKIHKIFIAKGFREVVTSSLIGKPILDWIGIKHNDSESIKVTNPQSEEYTMLRQNLIPNIALVVKHNFDQGQKNLCIYEIGKTFFYKGNTDEKNTGVEEKRILAGAISGNINQGVWKNKEEVDFYALKGVVETLLKELKIDSRVGYEAVSDVSYFHPGRTAKIKLSAKNSPIIGIFGELHPDTIEKCKFNQPVYVFEIYLDLLLDNLSFATPRFKQLPQFPAVTRDIAFIIPQNISCQDITKTVKKASSNLFKKAEIFDLYQGQHVPEGSKSVAFRITLQDLEATLTDEKIDTEIQKIRDGLKKAYSEASFRE
ncbi:MAG: phenylalanine--tRNA ligase subunit beta [bacterium]